MTQSLKEDTVKIFFCFADLWTCLSGHSQSKDVELTNTESEGQILPLCWEYLSPPYLECYFPRAEVSPDHQKTVTQSCYVYQC